MPTPVLNRASLQGSVPAPLHEPVTSTAGHRRHLQGREWSPSRRGCALPAVRQSAHCLSLPKCAYIASRAAATAEEAFANETSWETSATKRGAALAAGCGAGAMTTRLPRHRTGWTGGVGGYGMIAGAPLTSQCRPLPLEFDTERASGFEPLRLFPKGKDGLLGWFVRRPPE